MTHYQSSGSNFNGNGAKTLVPIFPDSPVADLLNLVHLLAQNRPVEVVGFVPIECDKSLSNGATQARALRQTPAAV
ncbi:MAG: hypothetical protein AAGD96_00355 [Chloroflexota bacterium]